MSKQESNAKRGVALIMSLVLVILMLGLIASYLTVSTSNLDLTAASRDTLQALYVAETGLARAFHELNVAGGTGEVTVFKSLDSATCPVCGAGVTATEGSERVCYQFACCDLNPALPEPHIPGVFPADTRVFPGTYSVEKLGNTVQVGAFSVLYCVLVPDERVKLISTGEFNQSQRTIEVTLTKPEPTEPPAFFEDFAWYSRKAIEIKGNVDINGDIYTAESATISGNSYSVDDSGYTDAEGNSTHPGDLIAVGTVDGNTSHVNGEVVTGAAVIEPPVFDVDAIIQAAQDAGLTVTEVNGDLTLNNTNLATTYGGGVVVVHGDITCAGNLTGGAILIATGSIHISGNATLGDPGTTTTLMIWAGDDIHFTGNCDINGIVFSNDDLDFNGTPNINGSLIAGGNIEADESRACGTPNLQQVPPDSDLVPFLNEIVPPKWQVISWRETGKIVDPALVADDVGDTGDTG